MSTRWWGPFSFEMGQTRLWRMGPFEMWLQRQEREFRLSTMASPHRDTPDLVSGATTTLEAPADAEVIRFGVDSSVDQLEIQPVTSDRAAVFKSDDPYLVPPGGEVTAFLSSPVWLRLQLMNPVRVLHELATYRPSDTWFGPSTLEGELCYAVRTSVRYNLQNLATRPSRAITVVRIANPAPTVLPLARLRLPLPNLSLFAGEDGGLWTEFVTLERRHDGDLAEIRLARTAPPEAGRCTLVGKPREDIGRHSLIRSFTSLLGISGDRIGHV